MSKSNINLVTATGAAAAASNQAQPPTSLPPPPPPPQPPKKSSTNRHNHNQHHSLSTPVFKLSDPPRGAAGGSLIGTSKPIAGVAAHSVGSFDLCSNTLNSIFHANKENNNNNDKIKSVGVDGGPGGYIDLSQMESGSSNENDDQKFSEILPKSTRTTTTSKNKLQPKTTGASLVSRNSDLISTRRVMVDNIIYKSNNNNNNKNNSNNSNQMWSSETNLNNKNDSGRAAAGDAASLAVAESSNIVFKKDDKKKDTLMQSQNIYTNVGAESYFNINYKTENKPEETSTSSSTKPRKSPPTVNDSNTNAIAITTNTNNNDDYYLNKSLRYVPLEVITNPDSLSTSDANKEARAKPSNAPEAMVKNPSGDKINQPAAKNLTNSSKSNVSLGKSNNNNNKTIESAPVGSSEYTRLDNLRMEALKSVQAQANKPHT